MLLLPFFLILSCETVPDQMEAEFPESPPEIALAALPPESPVQAALPAEEMPAVEIPAVAMVFDPGNISNERYESTKVDIQGLIEELNRIIRARNYSAWREYLADSYLVVLSSQEFLEEKTEELYMRDQFVAQNTGRDPRNVRKRILATPSDYFDHVVVPSRSNDRLDDIAFISDNHVRAYTVDTRGNRLILYDLAMIDNKWKIIS